MTQTLDRVLYPPAAAAGAPGEFARFRRQESILIGLNLVVLAALLLVHLGFSSVLGVPSRQAFAAIAVFFFIQTVELTALQGRGAQFHPAALRAYPVVSVWFKLGFAFLIAVVGGFEDAHYAVLMLMPIVAAAFRFRRAGVVLVVACAAVLTFLELGIYYRAHPPLRPIEFYEAATIILIYAVVGAVVGFFSDQHRRDTARLERSLAELERTRDRLVEEEKLAAVGRLSSAIAHEIRNPVAMILSSARLLGLPAGDPAEDGAQPEEMRRIVLGEARRLEKLTTDFLAYARIRDPERKEIPLREVLEYLTAVARARAAERGLDLAVKAAGDGPVRVDPFQVHQALLNLVLNAFEASPEGATVTVGGERTGETLVLWVENPGEPLPPSTVDRLFEPFFTTKPRGTGLGLAVARNIARAHGGDLWLAANEPGRTRFEMTLPGAAEGGG